MGMDISPLLNDFPIESADKKTIFQGDFPSISPNHVIALLLRWNVRLHDIESWYIYIQWIIIWIIIWMILFGMVIWYLMIFDVSQIWKSYPYIFTSRLILLVLAIDFWPDPVSSPYVRGSGTCKHSSPKARVGKLAQLWSSNALECSWTLLVDGYFVTIFERGLLPSGKPT